MHTARALSILAVTSELPWPLDTGGHLRTFHLLASLARSCDVRLVTGGEGATSTGAIEAAGVTVRRAHDGRRDAGREAVRVVGAALRSEPYVMYRRHYWPAVSHALEREISIRRPDVLYLDHLDSFTYAPLTGDALVVGDLHNVYSLLAARAASEQPSVLKRAYLSREARLLERAERAAARRAQLVMTVSDQEERYFRDAGAEAVQVVPNGVDSIRYADLPTGRRERAPIILYIGAMSWQPNVAAVRFLALSVLPALRRALPEARLRIVGRDPAPDVVALSAQPGVEVAGRVEDVLPHLNEASLLAVPLEAGGGTRLKILEAFAAGLPVVSTPVGCEGIDALPDQHLKVAARETFADAVNDLLVNPEVGVGLAEQARAMVRARYDWEAVGRTAMTAIREAHQRHRAGRRRDG